MVAGVSAHGFGGPGFGGPGGGGPGGGATITAINGTQLSLTTANGWSRTLERGRHHHRARRRHPGVLRPPGGRRGPRPRGPQLRRFHDRGRDLGRRTACRRHGHGRDRHQRHRAGGRRHQPNGHPDRDDDLLRAARSSGEGRPDRRLGGPHRGHRERRWLVHGDLGLDPAGEPRRHLTATTADSITVQDAAGSTATIHVDASTTYRTVDGTGSLADVTVGSVVRAEGVRNADGSLNASSVAVGDADGRFGGPGGRQRPARHRRGAAPSASPSASPSA